MIDMFICFGIFFWPFLLPFSLFYQKVEFTNKLFVYLIGLFVCFGCGKTASMLLYFILGHFTAYSGDFQLYFESVTPGLTKHSSLYFSLLQISFGILLSCLILKALPRLLENQKGSAER